MTTLDGSDGPSCCDSLGSRFTLHPRPHQSAGLREKAKRHSKSRSPHPDPPGLLTLMASRRRLNVTPRAVPPTPTPLASSPRWPHTN